MNEQILTNATVVGPDAVFEGTVRVADGRIAEVSAGRSRAPGAIDLEGDYLLPGLVEIHTDNLERNIVPRPRVRWPMLPAALAHDSQIVSAGITTVFDALAVGTTREDNPLRLEILADSIETIGEAGRHGLLKADHRVHLRCEVAFPGVIELFERFQDDPLVALVSLMDHTPGQRQFATLESFKSYYREWRGYDERKLDALVLERQNDQAEHAARHRRILSERSQARRHHLASHDDATHQHIEEAVALGVTIAEFPTTVEAAEAARAAGLRTIAGAPNVVRGGSHTGNISAIELAERGLLDGLSSDYMPVSLLHAAFVLNQRLGLDLAHAVRIVTANPADMVGLADRGRIASGLRADLVRVALFKEQPRARQVWCAGTRVA
jgi:alpha-D-ribose 1-methylphosphonate 5-triphosphate diphosphatase